MTKMAIIGAGLSGLSLATALRDHAEITLFDKSRGVGGRMATRYADPWQFDHGAQFFTADTEQFRAFLQPAMEAGTVTRWDARFAEYDGPGAPKLWQWDEHRPHYVATPKMNALPKFLAKILDVRLGARVAAVKAADERWPVSDEAGETLGSFDWVVSTAPAPQTAELLPDIPSLRDGIASANMVGCFALMLGSDEAFPFAWDAAHVSDADISWLSVNSAKPGRDTTPSLLVHSTNAWAEKHLEDDPEAVEADLLAEIGRVTGEDFAGLPHIALHRWRYANMPRRDAQAVLLDTNRKLAACGDWCIQGRVEAAFTSAMALADELRPLL